MQTHTTHEHATSEAVYRQFDPQVDSVVDEVLAAVAGARDLDLTESAPIAEVVDPDALEDLFAPIANGLSDVAGYVAFTYEGLKIIVESSGAVRVVPPTTS